MCVNPPENHKGNNEKYVICMSFCPLQGAHPPSSPRGTNGQTSQAFLTLGVPRRWRCYIAVDPLNTYHIPVQYSKPFFALFLSQMMLVAIIVLSAVLLLLLLDCLLMIL